MVENCRLHGIDQLAYLTDVRRRLVNREVSADVSDLLPRQRWAAVGGVRASGLSRTLTTV
jgi:hypothetical protein